MPARPVRNSSSFSSCERRAFVVSLSMRMLAASGNSSRTLSSTRSVPVPPKRMPGSPHSGHWRGGRCCRPQ